MKEETRPICRPWTDISLDLCDPIKVKGIVNSRVSLKCWVVVCTCRSTKAVELMATCGCDTSSFLIKHEEFIARHSLPKSIVSDKGSQLISADKVLTRKAAVHVVQGGHLCPDQGEVQLGQPMQVDKVVQSTDGDKASEGHAGQCCEHQET